MNIAELFVNLGIKGADKTVSALGSVKKGLGEVSSMSLEAKAGILAAMYGLERMAAVSGATGTGLTNFAALTGLSAKTLQQWQYAARQAGVSGEELTGSLKAVQNSMINMLLGKGAPEGLGIVSKAVGFDPKKARDSFYVMEQLQKAAQALPKDVGNQVLKSFGISEGTVAAMRRNAFNPDIMSKAPMYGDNEIASLNKSNIAWSNLGNKIEMAFGHFNAKHGQQLVSDISKIVDEVMKFVEALNTLAEKLKIFEVIGEVFDGLTKSMRLLNGESIEAIEKSDKKKHHFGDGTWWMNAVNGAEDSLINLSSTKNLAPSLPPVQGGAASNVTNIHQNIVHHGDAKDTKAVKDTHKAAINQAYRQRSAQRQGS